VVYMGELSAGGRYGKIPLHAVCTLSFLLYSRGLLLG